MLILWKGNCHFKSFACMLESFLKVAIRVFIRDRIYTLINIFGLAIGLAFSMVIFLYVHKELSYDRFHDNAHRIYRIGIQGKVADNIFNHAITPAPLAGTMVHEIPGVENAVRIGRFGAWLVRYGNAKYNEDNIIFADSNFFRFFSFPLIKGSPDLVLNKPFSIVLSRQAVQRYFGQEDPIGKKLRIENDSTYYEVTGIMEDIPENSHMHFDMVCALSTYDKRLNHRWVASYLYTFVLISEDASLDRIHTGLENLVRQYVFPDYQKMLGLNAEELASENDYYSFVMQPLTAIHLKSEFNFEFEPVGKILYIYIFTALAVIILIFSCMNFISLVTSHSIFRAKEVGIRKIAGSDRKILVQQFLLESSLMAFFAMAIALLFTELALPACSKFLGLHLSLNQLLNSSGIVLMITLIMVIGILSGLYPAWHLSSYEPKKTLYNLSQESPGKSYFRTGLVLFQLFIAVGAITMTLLIFGQYRYLINKDRGYETKNLVVIRRPDGLADKLEAYKSQISRHPGVLSVTNSNSIPGGSFNRPPFYLEGTPVTKNYSAAILLVSYGFDSTFRLKIAMGRFFDRTILTDSTACVINETAARTMGIEDPVGKKIIQLTEKPKKRFEFHIIGVVKDFHLETLDNPIPPLVIVLMPGNMEGYLTVRLTSDNQEATIQYLQTVWESYTSAYPFVHYILDEDRKSYYNPVRETGRVFTLLSVIAVLISSLGLFALVSYNFFRRKREVGIHKALGASNKVIILWRIRVIIGMIVVSSLAAWILSYFLINSWLKDYAYHNQVNFLYFLAATGIVITISLITIYYHATLLSRTNPGMALKYE
jgi:putative ABC transport system permease protein